MPSPPLIHRPNNARTLQQRRREYDARRMQNPETAAAAHLRSSSRWQKLRAFLKARWPLCCNPHGDHTDRLVPTADIHHVERAATNIERAIDPENLAPVCAACHAKLNAAERAGHDTAHLFAPLRAKLNAMLDPEIPI